MGVRKPTCQVCGRDIKLVECKLPQWTATGQPAPKQYVGGPLFKALAIAHHGYERKGGWQTSSCMGARRLPYEQAHDALDEAITACAAFINLTRTNLKRWLASPPDTLTQPPRSFTNRTERKPQPRPEGFDGRKCLDSGSFPYGSYEQLYKWRHAEMEQSLKSAQRQLKAMQKRREEWKEPK